MRGKVPLVTSIAIVMGITPAYAGKRISTFASAVVVSGSPPPMRGKAGKLIRRQSGKGRKSRRCNRRGRITPAYAGKSQSRKIVT